jgi:hypothetical protein
MEKIREHTSAGYTQEMMPIIVKKRLKTKFMATIARRALSFGEGLSARTKYLDKTELTKRAAAMPKEQTIRGFIRPTLSRSQRPMTQ